jgi:hypothetical protein
MWLKMGLIACPEMLVWNYHSMPHNIAEECRPQNLQHHSYSVAQIISTEIPMLWKDKKKIFLLLLHNTLCPSPTVFENILTSVVICSLSTATGIIT